MSGFIARHLRTQWNVGQGGFHTGEIELENGSRFTYVYDCGSASKDQPDPAITEYLSHLGRSPTIDVVFLSHIDSDHVNGIRDLLAPGRARARYVFLPLLSPLERLAVAARDEFDPANQFLVDFVVDPTSALHGLDEGVRVVEIRAGGEPATSGDGEGQPLPAGEELIADVTGPPIQPRAGARRAYEATDATGLRVLQNGTPIWLLTLYVARAVRDRLDSFRAELAALLGLPKHELTAYLRSDTIRDLLVSNIALLREAYKIVKVDTNQSSLVLLSGPSHGGASERVRLGAQQLLQSTSARWLLTGDAELGEADEVNALRAHFGDPDIDVLALPHHGALKSFDQNLLSPGRDGRSPELAFASSGLSHTSWRHPDSNVVKMVTSAGTIPWVVTEDSRSRLSAVAHPTP